MKICGLINRNIVLKDISLYPEQNLNQVDDEHHTFIYYQKNHCLIDASITLIDNKFYLTSRHKFYDMMCKLHNKHISCQIIYEDSSVLKTYINSGDIQPMSLYEMTAYHYQATWYNLYYFNEDICNKSNELKDTILSFFRNLSDNEITIEKQSIIFPVSSKYYIDTINHTQYLEKLNKILPLFSVNGKVFEEMQKLWN